MYVSLYDDFTALSFMAHKLSDPKNNPPSFIAAQQGSLRARASTANLFIRLNITIKLAVVRVSDG